MLTRDEVVSIDLGLQRNKKQALASYLADLEHPKRKNTAKYDMLIYGGATGGGKSYFLCAKAIMDAISTPGFRGDVMRMNASDLFDTTHRTFEQIVSTLPKGLVKNIRMPAGIIEYEFYTVDPNYTSLIVFRGVRGASIQAAEYKMKSLETCRFYFDELTEFDEEILKFADTRLRKMLPNGRHFKTMNILGATNPSAGYILDRYISTKKPARNKFGKVLVDEQRRPIYYHCDKGHSVFIPAYPDENKFNPEGYVEKMKRTWENDPDQYKIYILGSWDVYPGMVFPMFKKNLHTYEQYLLDDNGSFVTIEGEKQKNVYEDPKGYIREIGPSKFSIVFNSLDYGEGENGITCVLRHKLDHTGTLWTVGEIYETLDRSDGIAGLKRKLYELGWIGPGSGNDGEEAYTAPDPSIYKQFSRFGEKGLTVAELLMRTEEDGTPGLRFMNCSNDRISNITLLKQKFNINPNTGLPYWMIESTQCPNLIKEIPKQKWDKNSKSPKTVAGVPDHAVDAMLYAVSCDLMRKTPQVEYETYDVPISAFYTIDTLAQKRKIIQKEQRELSLPVYYDHEIENDLLKRKVLTKLGINNKINQTNNSLIDWEA